MFLDFISALYIFPYVIISYPYISRYNNPITLCRYVKGIRLSRAILPLARQSDSYLYAGFRQTTRWLHFVFNFDDRVIPKKLDKEYRPTHSHLYRLDIKIV